MEGIDEESSSDNTRDGEVSTANGKGIYPCNVNTIEREKYSRNDITYNTHDTRSGNARGDKSINGSGTHKSDLLQQSLNEYDHFDEDDSPAVN